MKNIQNTIIELTTIYEELNDLFSSDPCEVDIFQCLKHEDYSKLFQQLSNIEFERLMLDMATSSTNIIILNRLRRFIYENISIYNKRKDIFESLDIKALFDIETGNRFDDKFEMLRNDKEYITTSTYPYEEEKKNLLAENNSEINILESEKFEFRRTNVKWFLKNYYTLTYKLSNKFISIIDSYFPSEDKITITDNKGNNKQFEDVLKVEPIYEIEPDTIFKIKMFDKFLLLEKKLINDKYLSDDLHWMPTHKNGRSDIKRLVTFLVGLLDNKYFLPNKDPQIKAFFESRYHITIGQNFEKTRREELLSEYKITFYDYLF